MNVPTTLPFFNGTQKQAYARDGSNEVIFSPRTQLPPFQIQRPHVADDWVDDIILVDCDGNETDIEDYFSKSGELHIFDAGYWANGGGTFQNFDTLTTSGRLVTSAIKSTTGAGDAGFRTLNDFTSATGDRFYLDITITADLTAGKVAPTVYLAEFGTPQTPESNSVVLADGLNKIILTTTGTGSNHQLIFKVADADDSDFSIDAIELHETNRPEVHEFTDVDYIQYSGEPLIYKRINVHNSVWTNAAGNPGYETLTTSGTLVTSAINTTESGNAFLPDFTAPIIPLESGKIYIVIINDVVLNSGEAPFFQLASDSLTSTEQQVSAGDNYLLFTITGGINEDGWLQVFNTIAANWSCGEIEVIDTGLLPKGTYYIKLTDGTNEWYSEWFNIQDVYENLVSAWTNSGGNPYNTFVSSDVKILSAIESTTNIGRAISDAFIVANDEVITLSFFLTLNSGVVPDFRLVNQSTGATQSNVVTSAEGINEISLTATAASGVQIRIDTNNGDAANYSTSDIWVSRKYSPRFVKLQFSDTKDLHGKRNDDQTILYQESFVQECWLNTILNTPEGNRIDVGDEKNGVFIPEKIITQYKYKIIDYIHRSLFEALIRLPQHDSLTIIDEVGNEYTPDTGNIEISPDWSTFDTATVTILFNDGSFVRTENSEDIT